MILPYDGSERQSQTPSPPSQLVYLSNLNARYNSASDPHAVTSGSSSGGRPKKNFSRSAWNHEDLSTSASRRLSDIGEELSPARSVGFDEQEDEAQGQYQSQYQGQFQGQDAGAPQHGLTSWPGLPDSDSNENDTNDNASSSSSTISAGSTRARDVSKSHESISSQGQGQSQDQAQVPVQDQEQEQEPDLVQGASNELKGLPDKNTIASAVKGKGPGDEFSSAILSSEAERILDNAKKRLTVRGTQNKPISIDSRNADLYTNS